MYECLNLNHFSVCGRTNVNTVVNIKNSKQTDFNHSRYFSWISIIIIIFIIKFSPLKALSSTQSSYQILVQEDDYWALNLFSKKSICGDNWKIVCPLSDQIWLIAAISDQSYKRYKILKKEDNVCCVRCSQPKDCYFTRARYLYE